MGAAAKKSIASSRPRENRYGLRVSELSVLRWDQVDVEYGLLHV